MKLIKETHWTPFINHNSSITFKLESDIAHWAIHNNIPMMHYYKWNGWHYHFGLWLTTYSIPFPPFQSVCELKNSWGYPHHVHEIFRAFYCSLIFFLLSVQSLPPTARNSQVSFSAYIPCMLIEALEWSLYFPLPEVASGVLSIIPHVKA